MSDIFGIEGDEPKSIGELAKEIIPVSEEASETVLLPLGIYFDLDEDVYHADPGLGSTSIKDIAIDPVTWQYNLLRPKEDRETEAMKWGSALHTRILEGKEVFEHRYAKPPTRDDYPDSLCTTDDIKQFLSLHGQKLSGRKSDLVARAKEIDDCPEFFDEILAEWHEDHKDFVDISSDQLQQVEDAVEMVQRDPTLNAVMTAGTLINGAAEISIIYEIDGIRRKCRFDYGLAPTETRDYSLIVDLKSFTTFKGGSNEDAGVRKIYDMCYDIQYAYYIQGFKAARALFEAGQVFGENYDPEYLKRFLEAETTMWVWVMVRRDRGMTPIVMSIHSDDDEIRSHGDDIIQYALEDYRFYMDQFGPDQLWSHPPRMPLVLNSSMFPSYNRGLRYEQPEDR